MSMTYSSKRKTMNELGRLFRFAACNVAGEEESLNNQSNFRGPLSRLGIDSEACVDPLSRS